MCLFESQILFYQRVGTAGVNAINAQKGEFDYHSNYFFQ